MWPSLGQYSWGALHPLFLLAGICAVVISVLLFWPVVRWRGVAALAAGAVVGKYFHWLVFQVVYGKGLTADLVWATPGAALMSDGTVLGLLPGCLVGAAVAARMLRVPASAVVDAVCVGLVFGQTVGRIGCFANGCCFGIPTDLPWGVHFSTKTVAGLVSWPLALHPVQLYEGATCLAIGTILLVLRRKNIAWLSTGVYLFGYGACRFCFQFLRADTPRIHAGLSTAHWIALAFAVCGLSVTLISLGRRRTLLARSTRIPAAPANHSAP